MAVTFYVSDIPDVSTETQSVHIISLVGFILTLLIRKSIRCVVSPFFVTGNYVLNYLATRPKLAAFVTQALIQLYARITKLGWFDCQKDDYVFRNVIADVTRFLQVRMSFYHVIQTLLLPRFCLFLLYATVSSMCVWCVYRIVLNTAS